jgi:hypothetical protein
MTVGELIERLRAFDPNLPAVVSSYQGDCGYNNLSRVDAVQMRPDVSDEWYTGQHGDMYLYRDGDPVVDAVYLGGKNELAKY